MQEKRVLVYGAYGMGNVGDEAILSVIIRTIHSVDSLASIGVISANCDVTEKEHGVRAFQRGSSPVNLVVAIHWCDVLLVGGGTLIEDSFDPLKGVFSIFVRIALARLLGKKVMIYDSGIGPLRHVWNKMFARWALTLSTRVTVRDYASLRLAEAIGVNEKKVHLTGDPVLYDPLYERGDAAEALKAEGIPQRGSKTRLCITVHGPKIEATCPDEKQEIAKRIARGIYDAAKELEAEMVFIPMQIRDGYDDLAMIRHIGSFLLDDCCVYIVGKSYGEDITSALIETGDVVVGMRLHSLIFGARAGLPIIALSYSDKIGAFLEMLGVKEFSTSVWSCSSDMLTKLIISAWERREEIAVRISQNIVPIRNRSVVTRQFLSELLT